MRRLISISLALLMLAISMNVSVDFHYCKGKLAESKIILVFGNAGCGMEDEEKDCTTNDAQSLNKVPCCENHLQQIETDDYQLTNTNVQIPLTFIPLAEYFNCIPALNKVQPVKVISYHSPPDITSVYLPFTGVFLI